MTSTIDPTLPAEGAAVSSSVMRGQFQAAINDIDALDTAITALAPLNSPQFTGNPTAPTPVTTDNDTSIATTAYVTAKIADATAGVSSVLGNSGAVTLPELVVGGVAPLSGPALTGIPTAPTAAPGTNTTQIATMAALAAAGGYTAPYTGGVTRTVTSKLSDVISVMDFGATGNGTTDDTAAIQLAANAVPATGGMLYFPAGTYGISDGIRLHAKTAVMGTGRGSLMKALSTMTPGYSHNTSWGHCTFLTNVNGSYNGSTTNDSDISVFGMAFDGTLCTDQGELHAIRLGQVLRTAVENCYFNVVGDAVAHIGCDTSTVRACEAYGVLNCAYDFWSGSVNGLVDGSVASCSASAITSWGILFNAADTGNTASYVGTTFSATNNKIFGANEAGIYVAPLSNTTHASSIFQAIVTGNQITGTGGGTGQFGIFIAGAGGRHIVSGNQIFAISGGCAIASLADGVGSAPTDVVISNNLIYACNPSTGNVAQINAQGVQTTIVGNHIAGGTSLSNIFISGTNQFVANNTCIGWTNVQINTSSAINPVVIQTDQASGSTNINQDFGALLLSSAFLQGNPDLTIRNGEAQVVGYFPNISNPVNYPQFSAAATGSPVIITATGSDTNVGLNLVGKGTGSVSLDGTSTNNNAAAGQVGEYLSVSLPATTPSAVSNQNVANILSIPLTAGDWDVEAVGGTVPASTTITAFVAFDLSTVSGTRPASPNGGGSVATYLPALAGAFTAMKMGMRVSVPTTTTIYLTAEVAFSTSTCGVYGFIGARRAR